MFEIDDHPRQNSAYGLVIISSLKNTHFWVFFSLMTIMHKLSLSFVSNITALIEKLVIIILG